jgi:DNA-binding transcriptional MerR regulator
VNFARNMWQECLDDCLGDEEQAKKQYDKIMQEQQRIAEKERNTPSNVQNNPRQLKRIVSSKSEELNASGRSESDDSSSESSSTASESESDSENEDSSETPINPHKSMPGHSTSAQSPQRGRLQQLLWSKPGALSQRVGVSQSVLRNWADTGVVKTMVSAGGHRLFNVKSVEQHIAKATKSQSQNKSRIEGVQMVVFVRIRIHRTEELRNATADRIRAQVIDKYKDQRTEEELQSCLFLIEEESDAHRASHTSNGFSDTPGVRDLLHMICSRKRCLVILRDIEDITTVPTTYALLLLLCRNQGSEVEFVPSLCTVMDKSSVLSHDFCNLFVATSPPHTSCSV